MSTKKYLFGFILFFLMVSCGVKKPIVSSNGEPGKAISRTETKRLITSLEENRILYSSFSGKAKTKLEVNNKSFSTTLNLRIKHKEVIWISVTALLGIEVARILITPDRIQIINRLQSTYVDKPFEYIHTYASTALGFDEIEDLLVGNVMKFAFQPELNYLSTPSGFETKGNTGDLTFFMHFSNDFNLSQTKFSQTNIEQTLTSNYGEFQNVENQKIPKDIQVLIKASNLELDAIMNYNDIKINGELSFPFQVPSGYKQSQ